MYSSFPDICRKILASFTFLLTLFVLASFPTQANAVAQSPQPQVIYDSQLENSWQNYGWATINLSNTSPTYNGESDSISVTDSNSGGYGAMWFHPSSDFDAYS